MDGFKKLPKMQSFKTGGKVSSSFTKAMEKEYPQGATITPAAPKSKAKSAPLSPKETEDKVDVTAFKKGGRAKKEVGTVKKFKADAPSKGEIKTKESLKKEKSKPAGEKDAIKKVKPTGNKKAEAPSKGEAKAKLPIINKKEGGKIKKMADGGTTGQDPSFVAQTQAALAQPQNAWISQMNQMNAQHPFQQGVVNNVPGMPPFVINGNNMPNKAPVFYDNSGNPVQQTQSPIAPRMPDNDGIRRPSPVNQQPAQSQAPHQNNWNIPIGNRGSWNPPQVKGGATLQPTPLPVIGGGNNISAYKRGGHVKGKK